MPPDSLAIFEVPRFLVDPALRSLRGANTLLDRVFYDVGVLEHALSERGEAGARDLNLSARTNPEGCLLLIDPGRSPCIRRFDRVDEFIAWSAIAGNEVTAVTITGVGSSALGSAALGWNAALALGKPVAAIVPGYGLADVLAQGLGGWFGFEMHNSLASFTQNMLAAAAPGAARIGHGLLATIPGHPARQGGTPVFVTGSAASDVLHALLRHVPAISLTIGHSKGALAIGNALGSLDAAILSRMHIMTFGCPIAELPGVSTYDQFLGDADALGWLNAAGHLPERWIATDHSTNTQIPLSIGVETLVRQSMI